MSEEAPPIRRPLSFKQIILVFVGLAFLLLLVSPTRVRALISSNIANLRTLTLIQKVSLPSGMDELASYTMGDIDNGSCYQGYSAVLVGTNLDTESVASFYQSFFNDWDFIVENKLASEYPSFHVLSKQKTEYGRSIEGISISPCDQKCLSRQDFPEEITSTASEKYDNLYIIAAWHIPFEIRSNLCWCCSGG